jgi:hypothetical protein
MISVRSNDSGMYVPGLTTDDNRLDQSYEPYRRLATAVLATAVHDGDWSFLAEDSVWIQLKQQPLRSLSDFLHLRRKYLTSERHSSCLLAILMSQRQARHNPHSLNRLQS